MTMRRATQKRNLYFKAFYITSYLTQLLIMGLEKNAQQLSLKFKLVKSQSRIGIHHQQRKRGMAEPRFTDVC